MRDTYKIKQMALDIPEALRRQKVEELMASGKTTDEAVHELSEWIKQNHPSTIAYAARLHDVYDRAFDAALKGFISSSDCETHAAVVDEADGVALECVRTHAARMAELNAVITEAD